MKKWTSQIERTLGGPKFAVGLLILFSLCMIVGTFCESYYGTEFAGRLIYKNPLFMGLQLCMFLSIAFAALLRLPPRKRLYGFYTIHSGLILIGAGSFVTYYSGIDGQIYLPPQTPSRDILLGEDILQIRYTPQNKTVSYKLPNSAFPRSLNHSYEKIKLLHYLPFAQKKFSWQKAPASLAPPPSTPPSPVTSSASFLLSNANVQQNFTLSLHPKAHDFKNNLSLGPLTLIYLPQSLARCFGQNNPSQLILWNQKNNLCETPEERNISIQTTRSEKGKEGKRFFALRWQENGQEKIYSFFPDLSPWPMNINFKVQNQSSLKVLSKKIFEEKPHLFLLEKKAAFFNREEKKWHLVSLTQDKPISLPWMGLELTLLDYQKSRIPTYTPVYTKPIQKNNRVIRGDLKAVQIQVLDQKYWVTNERDTQLLVDGQKLTFQLRKSSLRLPFEFVLTQFKMDKDPGTNNPASYESFVQMFTKEGPRKAHIFMNNPLKYSGFTFYQASYSQDQRGNYASTLSANYDPGRFWKYLGSLMLVLGSLWHYSLNYRKPRPKGSLL